MSLSVAYANCSDIPTLDELPEFMVPIQGAPLHEAGLDGCMIRRADGSLAPLEGIALNHKGDEYESVTEGLAKLLGEGESLVLPKGI